MTPPFRLSLALPGAALLLVACVSEDGFPSLAMRPAERDLSTEEPVRPAVAVPSDAALLQRLAALRQQAQAGDRAFAEAYGPAAAAVAAAGAPESDGWVTAQQGLSRLEAARVETTSALRELDHLALEQAGEATNDGDYAAILAARDAVEALAEAQRARWEALRSRLAR